uniref:Mannose-1-phosphate guanyltransferase alpha-like n=1 Tax=Phallusia mammillata TaxID=59560 RepID=A0A6F9DD72_9ASCI|nr:mannose-1-phosphate guanyltransferase alpha-like [Phallusia mammillata]
MRIQNNMWKAVILIGGPDKGTRFRPLSLDVPKPIFPVAGIPMIQHHIEACSKVPEIKEVNLIGFFHYTEMLKSFITMAKQKYSLSIKYLSEYGPLGTAGGLYHFRDQILSGTPEAFFVFNSDVCCNFPLSDILHFHQSKNGDNRITIVATEATHSESMSYGCLVEDENTNEATHYVEKPETFVSSLINCGVYVFTPDVLRCYMAEVFRQHQEESLEMGMGDSNFPDAIKLETEILAGYAGSGKMFVYKTKEIWGQIKSAASAIHANKLYLSVYRRTKPEVLAKKNPDGPIIRGDVFIHESASVDPTAVLGPNVTLGENVEIGAGVRVSNSIVLSGAKLNDHCCVLNTIIGWKCKVGEWSRVEGTAQQPDPNAPYSKIISGQLFNEDGRLIPSITVLGREVDVAPEIIILNSIVLPNKNIHANSKNQIIL